MSKIDKARRLAYSLHNYQMYGKLPYSFHLDEVVNKIRNLYRDDEDLESLIILGYCHDLKEDHSVTFNSNLFKATFGDELLEALNYLTKDNDQTRKEYINAVTNNLLALKVKVADMMSNLEQSLKDPNKNYNRIRNYTKELNFLVNKLKIESMK